MIQEFGLSITTVGDDQYWVRTEKVSRGVQLAEEKLEWPIASWIEQTRALVYDPLLSLLEGQPPRVIAARSDLVHLGQTLHDELFKGQLRDSWLTAQGVAQNRQALLRLRIGIKDSRLQQLPWEALHAGNRPLAAGTDVIFSRYIPNRHQLHSGSPVQLMERDQRLRILMVIAAPSDQERLKLKQEAHRLQTELHPQAANADGLSVNIQLKILEQPGRAELTQELERGNYQALHYAGHSSTGNAGGDLYLVSRQTGLTERLSGEDLAGLLVNNGIKLAVFNSCQGSHSSGAEVNGWRSQNLVQALITRGMPAVIAMTERIPDQVAITFTQLLYRNLKRGQAIDLSLNRTRQGLISAYGSDQVYWVLPTLYMHPLFDGYVVKPDLVELEGALKNTSWRDAEGDSFGDVSPQLRILEENRSSRENLRGSVAKRMETVTSSKSSDIRNAADVDDSDLPAQGNASDWSDALLDESDETEVRETSAATVPAYEETHSDLRKVAGSGPTGFEEESKPVSPTTASHSLSTNLPELVGERRDHGHTLHTKILTLPGAMTITLLVLFSLTAVTWLQRNQDRISPTQSVGELSLPTQVDAALAQNDLDKVTVAIRALIDEERFSEALTALQSASPTQQRDAVIAFLKGRSHWELVKQNSTDHTVEDAMRAWKTALESESDWMEIVMALGFAQHALDLNQSALESWQRAVELAERQATAKGAYFSDKNFGEYALNAYAGIAIASLSLSEIETNATQQAYLLKQAESAYQQVISQAPTDFDARALDANWLWLEDTISDWENTKTTLSQIVQVE